MALQRKAGLGRGLSALLDDIKAPDLSAAQFVPIEQISANPMQPRRHFDPEALAQLAESIQARGVLQPILIRPLGPGKYEIVAGERRWRACQMVRMPDIPAMIREMDADSALQVGIIENVQRADLNPIEEAASYRRLIDQHGHTQDAVGQIVGKSRSHVANLLRLLELPESVRTAVVDGLLTMGHARALLATYDPEALMREVLVKGLSVRETEARAARDNSGGSLMQRVRPQVVARDVDEVALERQLSAAMGMKVTIAAQGQGGRIEVRYSSLDQLDMIVARLAGGRV